MAQDAIVGYGLCNPAILPEEYDLGTQVTCDGLIVDLQFQVWLLITVTYPNLNSHRLKARAALLQC